MASNPYSKFFFHLDAHALFMNPSQSLESHVLDKSRLESLMRKDVPVVPPDSIIKTYAHLRAEDVDLIVSTDSDDLSSGSFLIRQGEFSRFFLDIWFDPLYRSYNFARAETHSLVCSSFIADCRVCVWLSVLTITSRTISSSGIRPSWPGWLSSPSGQSTPTAETPRAPWQTGLTKTGT